LTSVAAGHFHTCGIATAGGLVCWGDNTDLQLTNIPGGIFSAPSLTAGADQTCVITTPGTLSCWGDNSSGQASPPAGTYTAASAGSAHACAIASAGTLSCWGDNSSGQSSPPAGTFTAVSAGSAYTCGLATAGTLSCWGDNTYGQLSAPAGTFMAVSAGGTHACAIATGGTLSCWGDNSFGQLNNIPSGTFTALSAGAGHTCAIATGGTISCWGDDSVGQLDNIPAGTFIAVTAGSGHTCALATGATLSCWGGNTFGQSNPPAGTFATVAAGSFFNCAFATSGMLSCWGDNGSGQLGSAPKKPAPAPAYPAPVGVPYSFAFTSSSGTPAGLFSVDPATLPPGLSLSSAGVLSGTPTTEGPFSFTVTVTNMEGTASALFSFTVEPPPAITSVTLSGNVSTPTVTLVGSGFGTKANLGPAGAACDSGKTYGSNLFLADTTEGWTAGKQGSCIGLIVSSYSNTKIVFTFGSDYNHVTVGSVVAHLAGGDSYTVSLLGGVFSDAAVYLVSLSPNVLAQGGSGPFTLTGSGFSAGGKVWLSGPATIKASQFTVKSPRTIAATFSAPAAAPVGTYSVMFSTSGHTVATCHNCLVVIAPPKLTSVSPNLVGHGSSNVAMLLRGTGFAQGATLIGPYGTSFSSVVFINTTTLSAKITVSATAATGTNLPVTVSLGAVAGYGKATANLLTIT
jgi:hypothetical protein